MNVIEKSFDAVSLGVFNSRLEAICDEMGLILRQAAFSPNIRERLDFSCALFDAKGGLCAQAAHIPVHLGSMAFAMKAIVDRLDWQPGDQVILNDPYLGGTHLPDVTLIMPLFVEGRLQAFVVNRAHHADIGAHTPGSMPVSRHLQEEGVIIEPVHLYRQGQRDEAVWQALLQATGQASGTVGDIAAQVSANRAGEGSLREYIQSLSPQKFQAGVEALNAYGQRLAQAALANIPDGEYCFTDYLDDDGQGHRHLPIRACVRVRQGRVVADFSGTAEQVEGNVNCPLPVAAAAVFYVFRCLMPEHTPACAGVFEAIEVRAPLGCLLNARRPAAVAAGNVETSSRVVDVVMGALAQVIPERVAAASQGTMNNIAMGSNAPGQRWDYYETLGGGMGAGPQGDGLDAVQTHMTNTLNTPIEVLEWHYPLRIRRYALRRGSGGKGKNSGGDGLIREIEFLQDAECTLLTERRLHTPWGLQGGRPGACGANWLNAELLPPKCHIRVRSGDVLRIETPGGGGFGRVEEA